MANKNTGIRFRKAQPSDVPSIHRLIQEGCKYGFILPRSLSEIYEKIRDFWVGEDGKGEIIAVCGFHPVWEDLAEIRSLVVKREFQGKGWGKELIHKGEDDLKRLGVKRIFVLTAIPEYFEKLGYRKIPKEKLPHKVWKDCLNCPYFPDCREEALIKEM